ncbi:NADP-dependent oxidoreductase [Brachybacterium endophyticum]|uniref:NADP-dependent oxidoreductase n=1 Tax=Brachybacterium endophyticum TaxID=2182385 RepID=A0A2U2RP99_9MICO|nr:NADP-dependent oxidoreductase [Brachybacterium endophyticum]PWH07686.1 NADP-dependent oxidoreductase [Brachybacterium endophyticum]
MRQIILPEFGGPENLHLEADAPAPAPAPGEVLVRVAYAGLNPLDYKLRDGSSGRASSLTLPAVLGREMVGEVISAGAGVDLEELGLPEGTRVFGVRDLSDMRGTYTEQIAIAAEDLAPVPEGTSDADLPRFAGLALAGSTALTALEDEAHVREGDVVLIHGGSGGVGQLLIPLALRAGASRVLSTGRSSNADRLRALGAEPIPYDTQDWEQAVDAATDGRGVDVVIDAHYFSTFVPSLDHLADGGRIVALPSLADVSPARDRGIEAHVTAMSPSPQRLRDLAAAVSDGTLDVEVSEILPPERIAEGHRLLEDGHARGKIVLDLRTATSAR